MKDEIDYSELLISFVQNSSNLILFEEINLKLNFLKEILQDVIELNQVSKGKDANMYICKAGHLSIRKAINGKKKRETKGTQVVEIYFFDIEE
ncbi:hypothetical protein [uncultured Cetobacterium sp.]|uniref:hypothetical protein n=1 Tax=uncultured Cetobacterium sp. TaxID=527638 RepID=UPI002634FC3C|nr:hypothetical protein [uncultured Cetobacterium sp.]